MTSIYGNTIKKIPGITSAVVEIAAERLMPPQYDEFCAAFMGETSAVTAAYWREKAEMWRVQIDESTGRFCPICSSELRKSSGDNNLYWCNVCRDTIRPDSAIEFDWNALKKIAEIESERMPTEMPTETIN